MIRTVALLSAALTALAACSEQQTAATGATAVAAAGEAAPSASGGEVLPGLWQVSVTTAPGEEPSISEDCIEPGEVDLQAELLKNTADADECTFARREIGGGRFNIQTECRTPEGPFAMKLTGAYGPTTMTYELNSSATVNGQTMPINWKVKSRRIAPSCPAEQG